MNLKKILFELLKFNFHYDRELNSLFNLYFYLFLEPYLLLKKRDFQSVSGQNSGPL
jgi:hypothetical protein